MKRTLTFAVALAAGAVLLAAGPVSAARKTTAPTAVTVVMHDPGCHWFSVNGAFKRTLTVKGPAVLTNLDEASLDIVGGKSGMHVAKIGRPVTLARGTYKIVMVNQANDDNVLTLFVK
jgi:hypothetical protein